MPANALKFALRRFQRGVWWAIALLAVCMGQALAAAPFAFQWEPVEDSAAIYWPQRRQPVPESLFQVSLDEARAKVQVLFSAETLNDFRLLAADEAGSLYAQARLASQVTHLVRSRDGGKGWESVWSLKAQSYGFPSPDLAVDILSLSFDPRDSEAVYVGTSAGLYLNNQPLARPPSTVYVAAVALHPQNPDILLMATQYWSHGERPSLSGKGLYRCHVPGQADGKVVWEDLSAGLPGQGQEIGFDLQNPNHFYIRTQRGNVYGQAFPEQIRQEDFGWERIAALPPQVQFASPTEDSPPPLLVPSEYVVSSLGYYLTDLSLLTRFDGYLFTLWGVIFAQNHWEKTGLFSAMVFGSRDGGFSWDQVGGYSRNAGSLLPDPLVLYDSQGRAKVFPKDLPNIAADKIGPWAVDPLDPFTFYVTQQGRGLLYRSQNLSTITWEELSQGLDPAIQVSGVAVDSLSNIYLRTGEGILRKEGTPHPFRLIDTHLSPDTLSAGDEFLVSARPVAHAGHQGAFTGTLSAELGTQRYPLTDPDRDGVYTGQLRLGQDQPVGFDGVTLWLEISGQPLARVSQRLQFMVVPSEEVVLYRDEVAPKWDVHVENGNLDLASARAFAGNAALQLEGRATWQYSGQPIHPFYYLLEFYAAAEDVSAIYNLRINEQSLAALDAHLETKDSWTRVAIPLEHLIKEPLIKDGLPKPALISELRFDSPGSVYLDEIRLVAARPEVLPPTVVAETRDAALPQYFHLDSNFPNPFNPNTTIRFALPANVQVELTLYDMAGQKVATLLSGPRQAGIYSLQWDGRDDQGRELASGVYFYRLQAGAQVETRKLLLLR